MTRQEMLDWIASMTPEQLAAEQAKAQREAEAFDRAINEDFGEGGFE